MVKDQKVENIYEVLQEPAPIADFVQSLQYSINTFRPFTKIRHISKFNNAIIYNQIYESGDYGLRKTPNNYYSKNPDKHIVIAGDSNVFGDGVGVENTTPVLLSKKFTASHPYNFGIRGGGPNNTLALMEFFPWQNLIKEKNGIFIYNYYDFLFERVIGFKNYILWTKGLTPYYSLDNQGAAKYQGNFNKRFLTKFFHLLNSFEILNQFIPNLPKPSSDHSIIIGKVFFKMYNEYKIKFPDGHFFVAINYNFYPPFSGRIKELEAELLKNKVPYIIIPFMSDDPKYLYSDLHLNSEGHQLEADLIYKALPKTLLSHN